MNIIIFLVMKIFFSSESVVIPLLLNGVIGLSFIVNEVKNERR